MTVSLELHSRVRKDGLQLIQIKVSHKEDRYRVASDIYVKKSFFNKKAKYGKWIKETHADSSELNKSLEKKIAEVKNHYDKHGVINPVAAIKGNSFFKFAEDFIKKYDNTRSHGTYLMYLSKLKKLKDYAGEKLTFDEITVGFIERYRTHLIASGNKVNTLGTDLKKIKAIFNQAIKEDVLDYSKNPFLKIKIKSEKSKKQRLSLDELKKIKELNIEGLQYVKDARNIFLFCINCMGMRIGDAMRLKHEDISGDFIIYSMNKTKDSIRIKINPELRKIIDSYSNEVYVFPYIQKGDNEFEAIKTKTALVNKGLKKISETLELKKHISSHVARHTWTQLAIDSMVVKNGKVNPRIIQKALGHESFSTTENYINELNFNDVNDLNDSIFE